MKVEHWDNGVVFEEGHPQKEFLTQDATKLCCTIEGVDWNDVMAKYHEHMGWEPYKPIED